MKKVTEVEGVEKRKEAEVEGSGRGKNKDERRKKITEEWIKATKVEEKEREEKGERQIDR